MKAKMVKEALKDKISGPSEEEIDERKKKIINSIEQNIDDYVLFNIEKIDKENNTAVLSYHSVARGEYTLDNYVMITIDLNDYMIYYNLEVTTKQEKSFYFKKSAKERIRSDFLSENQELDLDYLEQSIDDFIMEMYPNIKRKLNKYDGDDNEDFDDED